MIEPNQQNIEAQQEIINAILNDVPEDTAVEIALPSECRIYTLPDPEGPITIRPMTFEDERIMLSSKGNDDPINLILQKCVTNLNIQEILSADKLYLIMKLRELSYGDDYHTTIICPSCKKDNNVIIKLSDLAVKGADDSLVEPKEITLPILNKKVKINFPRVKHEKYFSDPEQGLTHLWRFIPEIDGHTDKAIIAKVLQKLPLKDVKTILKQLKTDFGLNTKIKFVCSDCGGASLQELPINASFFDVN
jgi:hypothetical protein